ncbi:MAG: hypothetical protein ACO3FE_12525, partial [Planctomycetaceae bacterium]
MNSARNIARWQDSNVQSTLGITDRRDLKIDGLPILASDRQFQRQRGPGHPGNRANMSHVSGRLRSDVPC